MPKLRYVMHNGNDVFAHIYESNQYGRTMVINGKLDPVWNIELYDIQKAEAVLNDSFVDFLCSLIPNLEED